MAGYKPIERPLGSEISCKGWLEEAAMRMLMHNVSEDVAEKPQELIVYGGTGKAARSWEAIHSLTGSRAPLGC